VILAVTVRCVSR